MSNGLIQSSGNNQELEEIGWQYLEELLSRSFFDAVQEYYPFLIFGMHDLIHELAISVAQMESSNMKVFAQDICPMTWHISFPNPSRVPKDALCSCLGKLSRIRTVMFEEGSSREFFLEMCISRFKHLRVIDLYGSSFDILPSSIGGLNHLRFLHLSDNRNIKKLPKSVCKLRNLQCLGLGGCRGLEELPADIKNMISLRVLFITTRHIGGCENLEALFDDIQSLTSLHKLLIGGCPKLASLPQGIKNMKALEDLWISGGCRNLRLLEGESNEPRFVLRLQSFIFGGSSEIVSLAGWLEGSASTLQRIMTGDCRNLRVLPEWLQNCSSLRTLGIEDCPRLSSLPDGIRCIATLTYLQIINCEEIEEEIRC
ncbi:putative disease resistance protein RGA3 [Syzygium oleosum]|uniref:putative disease resistance protein RGA3 n=1 Tax=Syzygium oleosum TaxID=219896 RepID=UPI0024BBE03D|nr:putative disease resistance protein RGA3 [Syzygium oleosum]